jgi:branched-chain amino acid transport system substrate-binding protein
MKKGKRTVKAGGETLDAKQVSRRNFMKTTAAAALVAAAGATVLPKFARAAAPRTIKLGYLAPKTGPLAFYAEPDDFVMARVRKILSDGVVVNGVRHPVEILVRDTRSDPNRAAEVASALIKSDKIDLMLPANTPDVVNPASDQAELNGIPCVSTDAPYNSYYFGRGATKAKGFNWTYNFFWGEDELIQVYTDMWLSIPTNKTLGALWSNTVDGNSEASIFSPVLKAKGIKIIDPGRFDPNTTDFSAQIAAFKQGKAEILQGVMSPPEFTTFWSQAAQQGFRPKVVTIAKALLFPAGVNTLGDRGYHLTTEVWWSCFHPFKSSLTGQTAAQVCDEWEKETKKQWTQPLGFKHALMEVAVDVLKRTKNIDSREAIRDAIVSTNLNTIVGHIQWTGNPVKNVCRTPLVGGQWLKGKKFKYDLAIVNNNLYKSIPTQATLKPLS